MIQSQKSGSSFFFKLFVHFWLLSVFVGVCGLSLVVMSGGYSSLWCSGFSCGSFCCSSWALEPSGFSSHGAWTYLLPCMWGLLGPGIEPESPALAGRFITTREVSEVRQFWLKVTESPRCRGTSSLYLSLWQRFSHCMSRERDRVHGCRHPHLELNLPISLFEVWLQVLDSHLVSSLSLCPPLPLTGPHSICLCLITPLFSP